MRRKPEPFEELMRNFGQHHGGRLLYDTSANRWMEAIANRWAEIPNRKVNRLIRNAGWPTSCASHVRTVYLQSLLSHSGPLPAASAEPPTPPPATAVSDAFVLRHAGKLIFYHGSSWWLRWSGSNWLPVYDREVNRLIREVSPLKVVKIRRDLERHIAFAVADGAFEMTTVKEMVS